MKVMLEGRLVETWLAGETIQVSVRRGCLQGGFLSLLLWGFIIYELLVNLTMQATIAKGM